MPQTKFATANPKHYFPKIPETDTKIIGPEKEIPRENVSRSPHLNWMDARTFIVFLLIAAFALYFIYL